TARAAQVLASCAVEGSSWEYGYVERLCHGATLPLPARAAGPFAQLAFSRDGTRLAAAVRGGVYVWDFPARTNLLVIPTACQWVQFSPDGKWLVVFHAKGGKLFDAKTGKPGREMAGLAVNHVDQAAFRPDGSHLAIVDPGREVVGVIDFATGE